MYVCATGEAAGVVGADDVHPGMSMSGMQGDIFNGGPQSDSR